MNREVGMFYRYKGQIGKYKKITELDRYPSFTNNYLRENEVILLNNAKFSYNIIDILEVGDYLNGFIVNEIERDNTNTIIKIGNSTFNVLENEEIYTPSNDKNNGYEKIEKLKSIVTHEQMEQMAYKVGD